MVLDRGAVIPGLALWSMLVLVWGIVIGGIVSTCERCGGVNTKRPHPLEDCLFWNSWRIQTLEWELRVQKEENHAQYRAILKLLESVGDLAPKKKRA